MMCKNVTFIGAHDSAFVSPQEALAANQHFDVLRQLDDGIRLLQSQGHKPTQNNASIQLCHTTCSIFDGGSLLEYLTKVKSWLSSNPDEVLTLLFTNPDGIQISTWGEVFTASGIADLAFIPSFSTTPADTLSWPTLGSMISSGKRVVIFLDAGANRATVPYILPEFDYMWETPFNQIDPAFPCTVDRPKSLQNQVPAGRLSVVNHFLDKLLTKGVLIPDIASLNVTNAVEGSGSLGLNAANCAAIYGRYPNFLLVDYYDVYNGSVFEVAAKLNRVPYIPSKSVAAGLGKKNGTSAIPGLPSAAAAKKVLPVFIIAQIIISGLILTGAFWLAWGADDMDKYSRIEDRATTLIPAKLSRHQKYDSIASVGSDAAFAVELERGTRNGHRRTDSTVDLVSHGEIMETTEARHSMESVESTDDQRDLLARRPPGRSDSPGRGYLEGRRKELWL
jgi:hypothetical protein